MSEIFDEFVADATRHRLRCACDRGLEIIARAKQAGRPLSANEDRQVRCLAVAEMPLLRRKYFSATGGRDSFAAAPRVRSTVTVSSDHPTVWLYGDIGGPGGITAESLRRELAEIPDSAPLDLHVHSDGGLFKEGIAIYSLLHHRPGPVHAYVDGRAASAGTFPLMAADTVTMMTGSWLMIHQAASQVEGGADDHRWAAAKLDEINRQLVDIYRPRWKGTREELEAALAAETWFSAEQAVAVGLADRVSPAMAIAAHLSNERCKQYQNIPSEVMVAADHADDRTAFNRRRAELKLLALV